MPVAMGFIAGIKYCILTSAAILNVSTRDLKCVDTYDMCQSAKSRGCQGPDSQQRATTPTAMQQTAESGTSCTYNLPQLCLSLSQLICAHAHQGMKIFNPRLLYFNFNLLIILFEFISLVSAHALLLVSTSMHLARICSTDPVAEIAQLGERQTEDLKVPGSIPGLGTLYILLHR